MLQPPENIPGTMAAPTFSFVLPVYNEEESLAELERRMTGLLNALDTPSEVILVNDGSRDHSPAMLDAICSRDRRFRALHLSRNFGHQIAITCGTDFASGQAIIIMDADLQDPPEVVHDMIAKWRAGFHVVHAVRRQRMDETWFKVVSARVFYRLINRMADIAMQNDVGDFRLMDRAVVDAFKEMRESARYVRGMISWLGFTQTGVEFDRPGRFAGVTKYPLEKMIRFALAGILSFSDYPLRVALSLGGMVATSSFLFGIWAIGAHMIGKYTVSGWTSVIVGVSFIGGVQLMMIGIVGLYLGRVHEEAKARPLYVVRAASGFSGPPVVPRRAVWAVS